MPDSPRRSYLQPEIIGQIADVPLRVHQAVEGPISGRHRSPLHGGSPEFADYREYVPGDDLRDLDWRAFGRSDRFYIKRYEEESNLRAHIVLDSSASMGYGRHASSKYDYAATLAVSLAALLLRQRDAVGLTTFDTAEQTRLRPSASSAQLTRVVSMLESIQPAGETDLGAALAALADQLPPRSLVALISDLLTDLDSVYEAIGKLQHGGHELLLVQVLDAEEIELPFNDSVIFRDIEGSEELFAEPWAFRRAYREAMEAFIQEIRDRCQFCGYDHVLLKTSDDLGKTFSQFLQQRLRQPPRKHRGRMRQLKS